jgi:Transposase DDE domain
VLQLIKRSFGRLAQLKKPFSAMMEFLPEHPSDGEAAMVCSAAPARSASAEPESFLDCLRYFLTPQLWKQVLAAIHPGKASRWQAQPLLFVLLVMTWCAGDSAPERFETARAFYIALYQKRRRPGRTCEGFQKALARVPMAALRLVAAAVRRRLLQVFAERFVVDGFIPFGCDGSRVQCPRSQELEERLPVSSTDEAPPQVWVTALVHLSLGVLWAWRLGKGTAAEREHLRRLLTTLPPGSLLVADAGYVGYELLQALAAARLSFLIRLTSRAPLYVPDKSSLRHYCEGLVYYWPQWAQKQKLPPIPVRLLRLRGESVPVCLITNVLEPERLPRRTASKFYRWRWRNEGLFRTYKRTLGKVKLTSRTVALVHRELEGSLLAVQLLLAQGAVALHEAGETVLLPSPRKILVVIRAEIRNVTGMYLGPRQRQTYWQRLQQARGDGRCRGRNKVRRPWPARVPHQSPGPPKILKMGTMLKALMENTLRSG